MEMKDKLLDLKSRGMSDDQLVSSMVAQGMEPQDILNIEDVYDPGYDPNSVIVETLKELSTTPKEPVDNFMRKSADRIFDIINSDVGKAFLPGAQMINVIDRLIEGAITPEELESLKIRK